MKKKILSVVLSCAMLVTAFTACSDKKSDETTKADAAESEVAESEEVGEPEACDAKIISVSPTVTEIVFALGYGENVIGVTSYDDYPADVFDIQQVGDTMAPDAELIASLEPDVVFGSALLSEESVNAMKDLGLNVVVIYDGENFDGMIANINTVADELGVPNAAAALTSDLKADYDAIVADAVATDVSVYYVVGYGEYGDYTAGAGTFIDSLITDAGAVNAGAAADGWYISQEALIEADPDYIILPVWATDFETMEPYASLSAVVNGNLIYVDNNIFDRQGPRNLEAIQVIADLVAEATASDAAA